MRRALFTYFLDHSIRDFELKSFCEADERAHRLYERTDDAHKRLSMKVRKTNLSSTEAIKSLVVLMQLDILEEPKADVIGELTTFTRMSF